MRKFKLSDFRNKHFLALAGNGVLALLGIVIMGLLYRSLEKTELGLWFFFLTIFSIGDALRNGFLQTATIKFYAGVDPERARSVLGSVWYLAIIITGMLLAVDVVAMLFMNMIDGEAIRISIKWFGVTFISSLPFTIMFWILYADERYDTILWLRMVNSGSMIAYIITLILLKKMSLSALLWCNLLTNCLTSIVGLLWGLGKIGTIAHRNKESARELIDFGKFSFASTVTSRMLSSTDTFIVTFMLGPAALAVYNLPFRLMEIVEIPLRSFVSTGMSAMAAAYNNSKAQQVVYILNKYAGMLTLAFIPLAIGAMLLANVAISLLGGGKYVHTEAPNIYRILMTLSLLYPMDRFSGLTLDIIHKPNINFYKVLIMLCTAIIGDFAGVYLFHNIYGVALASFLTVLAGLLYASYQLNKYIKFSLRDILVTGYSEMKALIQKTIGQRGG